MAGYVKEERKCLEEGSGDWRGSIREGSKNKRGIVVGSERVPKGKGSVCKGREEKKKGSCGQGEDGGVPMI